MAEDQIRMVQPDLGRNAAYSEVGVGLKADLDHHHTTGAAVGQADMDRLLVVYQAMVRPLLRP